MQERLVFNKAEHKLEELEKYGFVYCNIEDKEYEYYSFSRNKQYIDIDKEHYVVSLTNDDDGYYNEGYINNEILVKLYDLIKDGLVVKE